MIEPLLNGRSLGAARSITLAPEGVSAAGSSAGTGFGAGLSEGDEAGSRPTGRCGERCRRRSAPDLPFAITDSACRSTCLLPRLSAASPNLSTRAPETGQEALPAFDGDSALA